MFTFSAGEQGTWKHSLAIQNHLTFMWDFVFLQFAHIALIFVFFLFFENVRSTCFIKKKFEGLHAQPHNTARCHERWVEHEHKTPLDCGTHTVVSN
jgi:hypothetical protein